MEADPDTKPPAEPPPAPPFSMEVILQGYKVYRLLLLLSYVAFVGLGAWAALAPGLPDQSGPMGAVIGGIGLVFGAATLYSFFTPRTRWAWSYHAAMLMLGVPLCMTTPFALVVGWTWLHPGVRAYYGILPEPEEPEEPEEPAAEEASPSDEV
ncbi:MAG: hypothetical protein JKY65_04435 [Planctomycetes bacterium]|nr:hypothetical protein [Planctomycetota bacterium]